MERNTLKAIRQYLHQNPELSFQEFNTTRFIKKTLREWNIPFFSFKNLKTGGYADIGEGRPVYVFRADIDALPIAEDARHRVKSQINGIMHACGHDYHTAIGLGLLKYFKDTKGANKGTLRVIFQPGEEAAPGGAEKIINEPIWQDVRGIITIHVQPKIETGKFLLSYGPVQASSTSVKITLLGPGGHTSKPSQTVDLIQVAGLFVVQLQSFLNQHKDPQDIIAFAFGSIHGGSTHNIIPDLITLQGTLRTLDHRVLKRSLQEIRTFCQSFAHLYKIKINVDFPTNCPPTINDGALSQKFESYMLSSGRGDRLLKPSRPSMGADDFSFYLQTIPGLYLLVGGGGRGHLHSSGLELDENLLYPAVETLANFFIYLFEETT